MTAVNADFWMVIDWADTETITVIRRHSMETIMVVMVNCEVYEIKYENFNSDVIIVMDTNVDPSL